MAFATFRTACLAALASVALVTTASAEMNGSERRPAVLAPSGPQREALIVFPPAGSGPAIANGDAESYRWHLRLLGFNVSTVAATSRPVLDEGLRDFTQKLPAGAEVAAFFLGRILSDGADLYVVGADAPRDIEGTPGAYPTEGIRVSDVLRRMANQGPRELVAIVDTCVAAGQACASVPGTVPPGAGIIASTRLPTIPGAMPAAAEPSLAPRLLALMKQPGDTFLRNYAALREGLQGSTLGVLATNPLSNSFAFFPADLMGRLPHECNRVDDAADPATLRSAPLEGLVAQCREASQTWSFSPWFRQKLALVQEQRAFQKAVAACDDQAAIYLSSYPSGRYRANVEEWVAQCRPRAPQPQLTQPTRPDLPRLAMERLRLYYRLHSTEVNAGVRDFEALYAPMVRFYNAPIDRSTLAFKKVTELSGYPERHFQIREDTFTYQCDMQQRSCRVRGVVVSGFVNARGGIVGGPFTSIISIGDLDGPNPTITEECAETAKNKVSCY